MTSVMLNRLSAPGDRPHGAGASFPPTRSDLMLSFGLAAAFARRNIHDGWVVVGATFLTMLISAGAVGAPGVLLPPLQREFGWSTSEISLALASHLLLFGLMGPFAAALLVAMLDRHAPAPVPA